MADSRNRQLAQLGTGLDVNEATGEVISINMDTDVAVSYTHLTLPTILLV